MKGDLFLAAVLSNLILVPGALFCLAPMAHQLKYGSRGTILRMIPVLAGLILAGAGLECGFSLSESLARVPLLIVAFVAYHLCLTVHISKSLSIFAYVSALISVLSNAANGLDALIHPEAGGIFPTLSKALIQLGIVTVAAIVLIYPACRFGSHLVDRLDMDRIWFVTFLLSFIILFVSINMVPQKYETLYTNKVYRIFWILEGTLLALLILLSVIFYFIVESILNVAKIQAKTQVLEMQESIYRKQKEYMESTARARHDFKQTVRTLNMMAQNNDLEGIKNYLGQYISSMPENDVEDLCKNSAVNALLNHYSQAAEKNNIDLTLQTDLPEKIPVSESDLCSVIGNILDNAVLACRDMTEGDRYIRLSVTLQNNENLYIVAVNSFNGRVRPLGGFYRSTRSQGNGIGLLSVAAIASNTGGTARFYHEGNEFYSDVMMRAEYH
ncbi:MAG: GHKL domain-containing protein [Lachnospiraceae bacterium]|nr:GHKL domain-containing protein [Lachnospiraceae bacterium]